MTWSSVRVDTLHEVCGICGSMQHAWVQDGVASEGILPSMPMAAPKAIQIACSLGRVLPRVLLRRAPAAEPATAPKNPMALVQAPAKTRHISVTSYFEGQYVDGGALCKKLPELSWRELLRGCRSGRMVGLSEWGKVVPQAVQQTLLGELMRVQRGHAQTSWEITASPISLYLTYLVPQEDVSGLLKA